MDISGVLNFPAVPVSAGQGRQGSNVLPVPVRYESSAQGALSTEEETQQQPVRRVQEFTAQDGRTFTRSEEIAVTANGFRRTVIQQNVSGSTIRLEEVLDRQGDGNFRRTSRFTDAVGEVSVKIENGVYPAGKSVRGTYLDIRV